MNASEPDTLLAAAVRLSSPGAGARGSRSSPTHGRRLRAYRPDATEYLRLSAASSPPRPTLGGSSPGTRLPALRPAAIARFSP